MKKIVLIVLAIAAVAAGGYFVSRSLSAGRAPTIAIDKTGGYKLTVNDKPFIIRGACYNPIPVGKDYEYNFWGDPSKPWLTDGKLMKDMGINTVRIYRPGKNPAETKQALSDLYKKCGIHTLMGHFLGFWNWPPPNYSDGEFKDKVRQEVLEMVRLYKDSPGVLMWVLGNENNYSFDRNIQRWTSDAIDALKDPEEQRKEKARLYYSFVDSLARDIKKIDSRRPVVMAVGETASLDLAQKYCPNIDVIGMLAYRGPTFGNLFREVKKKFDLPIVMIEWGADSYNVIKQTPDEDSQAEFLKNQWQDIYRNTVLGKGEKNCLGGTFFEWTDEWWKGNENLSHTWSVHDTAGHWASASYYFDFGNPNTPNMNEEWWGAISLDPEKKTGGIDGRVPKKAYSILKSLWTKKT